MGKDLKGKELGVGIAQRSDGRYMARFTDRFGRRCPPMYAKTEREIKKLYRDAKYEDEHAIGVRGSNPKLGDWFDAWTKTFGQTKIKYSTLEGYIRHFNAQIRPYLGNVKLQQLTPYMIQEWVTQRYKAGLKSVRSYLSTLKSVLDDAVVASILAINPADKIKGIAYEVQKTPSLTLHQLRYLLQNFEFKSPCTDWKPVVQFLALTGYRFGEMAGLQWKDIDWSNHSIYVRRTLHAERGKAKTYYFTTPKTSRSTRTTPLSPELETLLLQVHRAQEEWKIKYCSYWEHPIPNTEDLVFTSRFGTALDNSTLAGVLVKVVNRLNEHMPLKRQLPRITAHGLRGTFANVCYAKNMRIKDTQALMGHGEQYMTLYYTSIPEGTASVNMHDIGETILADPRKRSKKRKQEQQIQQPIQIGTKLEQKPAPTVIYL